MAAKVTNKSMEVHVAQKMRDIVEFVNTNHIAKEDILEVQHTEMGDFMLVYFKDEE